MRADALKPFMDAIGAKQGTHAMASVLHGSLGVIGFHVPIKTLTSRFIGVYQSICASLVACRTVLFSADDVASWMCRLRSLNVTGTNLEVFALHGAMVSVCFEPWACAQIEGMSREAICYYANFGEYPHGSDMTKKRLARQHHSTLAGVFHYDGKTPLF